MLTSVHTSLPSLTMPRKPLVCSVWNPASIVRGEICNGCLPDQAFDHEGAPIHLRVRRLRRPLPVESAIAPSFSHPLASGAQGSASVEQVRDPFVEVGVSSKCLLRLGTLSGGWAILRPADSHGTCSMWRTSMSGASELGDANYGHLCRVIATDGVEVDRAEVNGVGGSAWMEARTMSQYGARCSGVLADDDILVPPSLAFNVGLGPYSKYVRLERRSFSDGSIACECLLGNRSRANGFSPGRLGFTRNTPLSVARWASVARVKRPRPGSGNHGCGSSRGTARLACAEALALTAFFSSPRVLCVGEVFGVSMPTPCLGGRGNREGGDRNVGGTDLTCWWDGTEEDEIGTGGWEDVTQGEGVGETVEEEDGPIGSMSDKFEGSKGCWVDDMTALRPIGEAGPEARAETVDADNVDVLGQDSANSGKNGHNINGGWGRGITGGSMSERKFQSAIFHQGSEVTFFMVTSLSAEEDVGNRGNGEGTTNDTNEIGDGRGCLRNARLGTSVSRVQGLEPGGGGRDDCMVVSRTATELRQSGTVNSLVPDESWYHPYLCLAQGLPTPPPAAPLDESSLGSLLEVLAPLVGPEAPGIFRAGSRPVVLLHSSVGGSSDGGRGEASSLIGTAAERLGLHVRTTSVR
ncbi:unnamed protein product, partial [Choristocarpus tenellus]